MNERDILNQLAQDARRLRVARKLPDGKLSTSLIVQVCNDARRFREKHGISLEEMSRRMGPGFSTSVLSNVLRIQNQADLDKKYSGDVDRVVRGINDWMEMFERGTEAPRPSGFVETQVAKRIITVIQSVIELRSMGLVYGPAGVGKTMTAKAAHAMMPGSMYVRLRRSNRSPSGFARHMAKLLKLEKCRTTQDIEDELIKTLSNTDRVLLIDEAHQANTATLEFIRDIHDECELPVVLFGTRDINEKCSDTTEFFGQFNRRISFRYDVGDEALRPKNPKPVFSIDEIIAAFQSDKVRLTDDGAARLTDLSNLMGLGSLGWCREIVFVAAKLAKGKPIDATIVNRVLRKMHGRQHADYIAHRRDEMTLKVAG